MWIYLEDEEYNMLDELLVKSNLHGLRFLIKRHLVEISPANPKHTKKAAIQAAKTYFSASDLIIGDDHVKWLDNGDALVMAWQVVPSVYITESDCGCKDKVKK